jgi:hypothetical protein
MLKPEQLESLRKLAEKNEDLKELLKFYTDCQTNGMKKLFIEMNNKFSAIADSIRDSNLSLAADDKSFERFMKVAVEVGTMQDNYSKMEEYMFGEKDKEEDTGKSFLDRQADKKRV